MAPLTAEQKAANLLKWEQDKAAKSAKRAASKAAKAVKSPSPKQPSPQLRRLSGSPRLQAAQAFASSPKHASPIADKVIAQNPQASPAKVASVVYQIVVAHPQASPKQIQDAANLAIEEKPNASPAQIASIASAVIRSRSRSPIRQVARPSSASMRVPSGKRYPIVVKRPTSAPAYVRGGSVQKQSPNLGKLIDTAYLEGRTSRRTSKKAEASSEWKEHHKALIVGVVFLVAALLLFALMGRPFSMADSKNVNETYTAKVVLVTVFGVLGVIALVVAAAIYHPSS